MENPFNNQNNEQNNATPNQNPFAENGQNNYQGNQEQQTYDQNYNPYGDYNYGMVPQEAKGWNWGAFMHSLIWGFGNKSYLVLLNFIPLFGIVWKFVCGAKGNEWAWKNGGYRPEDINTFKRVQDTWNRAGLVSFIISIAFVILYIAFIVILGVSIFRSPYY